MYRIKYNLSKLHNLSQAIQFMKDNMINYKILTDNIIIEYDDYKIQYILEYYYVD